MIPGTPEAAFYEFQTTHHKESYIVLPLCIAGESVVPLVAEKIKSKDLDRRLYAIVFLGTVESKEPIPVLQQIAEDESDNVFFRSNALNSLYMLDEKSGVELATTFKERDDFLGEEAARILNMRDVHDYEKIREAYKTDVCHPTD